MMVGFYSKNLPVVFGGKQKMSTSCPILRIVKDQWCCGPVSLLKALENCYRIFVVFFWHPQCLKENKVDGWIAGMPWNDKLSSVMSDVGTRRCLVQEQQGPTRNETAVFAWGLEVSWWETDVGQQQEAVLFEQNDISDIGYYKLRQHHFGADLSNTLIERDG